MSYVTNMSHFRRLKVRDSWYKSLVDIDIKKHWMSFNLCHTSRTCQVHRGMRQRQHSQTWQAHTLSHTHTHRLRILWSASQNSTSHSTSAPSSCSRKKPSSTIETANFRCFEQESFLGGETYMWFISRKRDIYVGKTYWLALPKTNYQISIAVRYHNCTLHVGVRGDCHI